MATNRSISDIKFDLANPAVIFTVLWIFSLLFYSLQFTINILGLNINTIILISLSILSFWVVYLFLYLKKIVYGGLEDRISTTFEHQNPKSKLLYFKRIIKTISIIWFVFSLVEIVYFKGVPLISVTVLGQSHLDYKAFGLPTVHGFLNACFLISVSSYAIFYFSEKNKRYLFIICLFLVWPVLVMSRALLLWALLEVFGIYLIFYKLNLRRVVQTFLFVITFIYIFGLIGDNRGDAQEVKFTDNFIKEEYKDKSDYIPSGFIWVYLYMTTPINNIVLNIDKVDPKYNFRYTSASLVPSVIRDKLYDDESEKYSVELYEEAFNVSSYYANYLKDFGLVGTLILGIFMQSAIVRFFLSARKFKIGSMLAYSCLFYAIMLSVFSDFFFSLVTVFQVLLGLFINYLLYSKNKKIYVQE